MQKTKLNYLEMKELAIGLIGREVKVLKSASRDLMGIEGIIVDETLKTLKVKTKAGIKTIPKNSATLMIRLGDKNEVKVDGRMIMQRPEERIKKWWRKLKKLRRTEK